MKPAKFTYLRPSSLSEALELLHRHGEDASLLAGGQSLMPMLNLRFARPAVLIDIKRIPGLSGIAIGDGVVSIGALTRHFEVAGSPIIRDRLPLVHEALRHVAHAAIRNRGTFGGSLALADPAAELPACCVCLDAAISTASLSGFRSVPASKFFRGVYDTALAHDELISRIEIPLPPDGWTWSFDEVSRRHGDFAVAGIALGVRLAGDVIMESRVAFCGLEAAPRRLAPLEERLRGVRVGDRIAIGEIATRLADHVHPLASEEYPAFYRIEVASALLQRVLARTSEAIQ